MSHPRLLVVASAFVLSACAKEDDGYTWSTPWEGGAAEDEDDGEDDDAPAEDEDDSDADDEGMGETTADPSDNDDTGGAGETGPQGESGDESTGPGGMLPPDSPYQGGWDIGACQDEITAGGATVADFDLVDQFGDTVRLYDFCHKAILLVGGAFW